MKQQNQLPPIGLENRSVLEDDFNQLSRSQHYDEYRKEKMKFRRPSVGSAAEMLSMLSTSSTSKLA
jgi:hypothetical protein